MESNVLKLSFSFISTLINKEIGGIRQASHHNGLVLSPRQNPISSPASPTHSLTPFTAALAMPVCVLLLLCLVRVDTPPTLGMAYPPLAMEFGSWPGLTNELPAPVAYSDPMDGRMFSPADSETNSANGTSHTPSPKKLAISVNVGTSSRDSHAYRPPPVRPWFAGRLKCRNQNQWLPSTRTQLTRKIGSVSLTTGKRRRFW